MGVDFLDLFNQYIVSDKNTAERNLWPAKSSTLHPIVTTGKVLKVTTGKVLRAFKKQLERF